MIMLLYKLQSLNKFLSKYLQADFLQHNDIQEIYWQLLFDTLIFYNNKKTIF